MKKIFPYVFFFFVLIKASAQCPTGNILWTQQSQVDNFPITWPNCKELPGSLNISTSGGIDNIRGLINIRSIAGDLSINFNKVITSLSGLENLTYIGGGLDIYHTPFLTNLAGLYNLTSVGSISITENSRLRNLQGLEKLEIIRGGLILEETGINSLIGIDNVVSAKYFYIKSNPSLTYCAVQPLCNLLNMAVKPPGSYIYITAGGNCSSANLALACGALPVELADFTVKSVGESVDIRWETVTETNSESFQIQHSVNGEKWNILNNLLASSNSLDNKEYNFVHSNPALRNNYYRLKMIDKDESYSYSKIAHVYFEKSKESNFFPNPVSDVLTINITDWPKISSIEIYNLFGKIVHTSNQPTKNIDVRMFPQGEYLIKIEKRGDIQSYHKILIKR